MHAINSPTLWGRDVITSAQIRAARSLLQISQQELAAAAGVAVTTIARMEKMPGKVKGMSETIEKIEAALEAKGVQFVEGGAIHKSPQKLE